MDRFLEIKGIKYLDELLACPSVVITEKLDGMNFRVGTDDGETIQWGSHGSLVTENDKDTTFKPAIQYLKDRKVDQYILGLYKDETVALYFEFVGKGVQSRVYYIEDKRCVLIAVKFGMVYQPWDVVEKVAKEINIDVAPLLYRGKLSHELMLELRNGKSLFAEKYGEDAKRLENNIKEGIVIFSDPPIRRVDDEWLIAKFKNEKFKEEAPPKEIDPTKLEADGIAKEFARRYVTLGRLENVLSHRDFEYKFDKSDIRNFIGVMKDDVIKEAEDYSEYIELIASKLSTEVQLASEDIIAKAVCNFAAQLYLKWLEYRAGLRSMEDVVV